MTQQDRLAWKHFLHKGSESQISQFSLKVLLMAVVNSPTLTCRSQQNSGIGANERTEGGAKGEGAGDKGWCMEYEESSVKLSSALCELN